MLDPSNVFRDGQEAHGVRQAVTAIRRLVRGQSLVRRTVTGAQRLLQFDEAFFFKRARRTLSL